MECLLKLGVLFGVGDCVDEVVEPSVPEFGFRTAEIEIPENPVIAAYGKRPLGTDLALAPHPRSVTAKAMERMLSSLVC